MTVLANNSKKKAKKRKSHTKAIKVKVKGYTATRYVALKMAKKKK